MAPGHLYFLVLLCNHTSVCIFEWLTRDPGTFNGELALASSTLIDAQSGMLDLHAHRGVVGWDAGSSCTLWCYLSSTLSALCFLSIWPFGQWRFFDLREEDREVHDVFDSFSDRFVFRLRALKSTGMAHRHASHWSYLRIDQSITQEFEFARREDL